MVREHVLRAGVFNGHARCTVCTRCGSLWWTPRPAPVETYSPRYCAGAEDASSVPLGVELVDDDLADVHFVGDGCPDGHVPGLIEDLLVDAPTSERAQHAARPRSTAGGSRQ